MYKTLIIVFAVLLAAPSFSSAAESSCVSINKSLAIGSRGTEVTKLQKALFAEGLVPAQNITGYFGPATRAAVQKLQIKIGVISLGSESSPGYGKVGPQTRAAILKFTCNKKVSTQVTNLTVSKQAATSTVTSVVNSTVTSTLRPTTTARATTITGTPSTTSFGQSSTFAPSVGSASSANMGPISFPGFASETCNPHPSEKRSKACPAGSAGEITETRSATCNGSTGTQNWSEWSVVSNSCVTPTSFQMSNYWPTPSAGNAYLKFFSTDFYGKGASVNSLLAKTVNIGNNNYTQVDVLSSMSPQQYVSTWYLKIIPNTPVVEYRDDSTTSALVYKPGKEIQWGGSYAIGQSVDSNVEVDVPKSQGAVADSASNYGFNRLTLLEYIPSIKIDNTTFEAVLRFNIKQYFCITNLCTGTGSTKGVDYHFWDMDYWMAPGKGIVQTKYLYGDVNGRIDYLSKECTVTESQWYCN